MAEDNTLLTDALSKDLESCDAEKQPPPVPRQWQYLSQGSGQCEYQGYDTWTPEEQQMWKEGALTAKWGIGQVSIRVPVKGFLANLAIMYGYIPFIIPIWWFIWVVETYIANGKPRFFPLYGLAVAGSLAVVNETVTKKLCRKFMSEDLTSRPAEAVCKHPGMPSGHVMNAFSVMFWCLLEVIFDDFDIRFEWIILIVLALGPVPWARVYNKDHTVPQVAASACCALFVGLIAFLIRRACFPNHGQPWDWYYMKVN
eukprot:TRINITY_DN6172_c0_g1_i1.p1 TRINITY_DN6172_c0_g1~~TRINITY_DN6172_c0_g1_i1.p1  ORF type:complete len:256 (-),score=25.91 TRINITY_DN6172_c0_g1_i1:95-862(-)